MRRSTRLGLIGAVLLALAVGGVYTAYWMIAAGRLKDGFAAWAESMRGRGLDANWQRARVTGYPFAFRLEVAGLRLHGTGPFGAFDLSAPVVSGNIGTTNFYDWSLAAPQGLDSTLADRAMPVGRIEARSATGAVSVAADAQGGIRLWLTLQDASAEPAGEPAGKITAAIAHLWIELPTEPAHRHDEPNVRFAADLHQLGIPTAPSLFTSKLDDLGFGVTVMGAIPSGPAHQAADAWRRDGGTVELDHLDLDWGGLRIEGSGTLALDSELQPVGAFSGTLEGYDRLLKALVQVGRIKPGEAGIAQLALAMFARTGPDGSPQIDTSFTIQNGEMFLGPVKLGPAPRIDWR